MTKILNGLFYFLKFILYLVAFGTSLYVMVKMYQRNHREMLDLIKVFMPYIVIIILFVINMFLRQKPVTNNVFFNLTCCLVFFTISLLAVRAFLDPYMIYSMKNDDHINFNFFSDSITFINVMIYGLCLGDFFLMFSKEKYRKSIQNHENNKREDTSVAVKIDTL